MQKSFYGVLYLSVLGSWDTFIVKDKTSCFKLAHARFEEKIFL